MGPTAIGHMTVIRCRCNVETKDVWPPSYRFSQTLRLCEFVSPTDPWPSCPQAKGKNPDLAIVDVCRECLSHCHQRLHR